MKILRLTALLIFIFAATAGHAQAPAPAASRQTQASLQTDALRQALLAAEDNRVTQSAELEPFFTALKSTNAVVQRQAVRALGRLERKSLIDVIIPLLTARSRDVRAEAANALAQSFGIPEAPAAGTTPAPPPADPDVPRVSAALIDRLKIEADPIVRAALTESLGRLPFSTAEQVTAAGDAIMAVPAGAAAPGARNRDAVIGIAKGLEALVRAGTRIAPPPASIVDRLRQMAVQADADPRARRLALTGLLGAKSVDLATIDAAAKDPDPQVRRLATMGAGALAAGADKERIIVAGLQDAEVMVRYDALRMHGALGDRVDCQLLLAAIADSSPQVALLAVDLLGSACKTPEAVNALAVLGGLPVTRLPSQPAMMPVLVPSLGQTPSWHARAHALVGLTKNAPDRARELLPRLGADPVWQVRMYAARAAAPLREGAWLERLARDVNDNVREAALEGLGQIFGHDADKTFIESLARPDYQLVRSAANALVHTALKREATAALLTALERITAERKETSRDTRIAILERLWEVGNVADAPALTKYVEDFDPAVASYAARVVSGWTAQTAAAAPKPLPIGALPDTREVDGLAALNVKFVMKGRGEIVLRLLPAEAPVTAAKFVRLARAGHYAGLTFHRVVPNFVIQGGSPGANEYMGDGPFMRDEVGSRPHLRGSVGISTRGRDTGDAQIFIDLVDLPRLDHTYTVFAEVASGLEVLDAIVEGDVIERVEVAPAPPATPAPRGSR